MTELKVNPYDPSTNAAYDPSTNAAYGSSTNAAYGNAAYDNAPYPAGPTAPYPAGPTVPMNGGSPPSYTPAPMVQPMTVGVPVATMITRQAPPMPPTYVVNNVMVLIFCCFVFGIIGVIKGSQVDTLYIQGHYEAAEVASLSAKKWYTWGLICGAVVYVSCVILFTCLLFI